MDGVVSVPRSSQSAASASDHSTCVPVSVDSPMTKLERLPLYLLFCLTVVYVGLAIYLSRFHAFWSPDSGARFAMIDNQIEHGRLIYTYYSNIDNDPTGQIHPLAYFLFRRDHDLCVSYPPVFPFLSGILYRVFGFSGLTLLPVLSGLGAILAACATAQRLQMRARSFLPLVMGLATPVILYSVVFWDHSAMMLVAALAGYWMLRALKEHSLHNAVVTGVVLGSGVWVHELLLALSVAALLSALPFLKQRGYIVGGLLVGFVPLVLAWGVFNLWIYGGVSGPHLGTNVLQNNSDHPFSLVRVLDQTQLAERAMVQLVGTNIIGSRDDLFPLYLALVSLLIVYTLAAWSNSALSRITFLLSLGAAALALYLLRLSYVAHSEPSGMFEATPLLIPALAVPWYVSKTKTLVVSVEAAFYAWASRTCWLFVLFVIFYPMLPGVDWGSRYLLPALPLLLLLSVHALERQYQEMKRGWRTFAVANTVGLIGISLVCQCFGLAWIHRSIAYNHELNAQVRRIKSPVLVTDLIWLAPELTSSSSSQTLFMVRSENDQQLFTKVLGQLKPNEMTYIGNEFGSGNIENALTAAHQPFVKTEARPLWRLDHERQEGEELQLVRFTLKPKIQVKRG